MVDNDPAFLERAQTYFHADPDIELHTFPSGETFWREVKILNPHVAFVDIRMPGIDGIELVGLLAERYPHIHRVMLTNMDSEELIVEALKHGATGYVLKSEMEDIRGAVRIVLSGGAILTPTVAFRVARAFQRQTSSQPANALTMREKQVLELMVQGLTMQKVAAATGTSLNTIRSHAKSIYRKLEIHDKSALFRKAHEMGLM